MPSSPNGPCSSGNTTSTSPSSRGGWPGSSTVSDRRGRPRAAQHVGAVPRRPRGACPREPPAAPGRRPRGPTGRPGRSRSARRRSVSRSIAAQDARGGRAARPRARSERPPKTTATRGFRGARAARASVAHRGARPYRVAVASYAGRPVASGRRRAARTTTVSRPRPRDPGGGRGPAARRGPARRSTPRWCSTSTYVPPPRRDSGTAATATRPGTRFEEALGALEGGDAPGLRLRDGRRRARCRWCPHGGARRRAAARLQRHLAPGCAELRGARAAARCARSTSPTRDAVVAALRRRRRCSGSRRRPTRCSRSPTCPRSSPRPRDAGALSRRATTRSPPRSCSGRSTLGADVVVHSVTKYLAGHSDVVLGRRRRPARRPALRDRLHRHRTCTAPSPGPARGVARAARPAHPRAARRAGQANAAELARRLAEHPAVARVRYPCCRTTPGTSGAAGRCAASARSSVELPAGRTAADAVAATTRLWVHATSLGGVESTHGAAAPARRRSRRRCPEDLLRLSVGIEDVEDLWADLSAPPPRRRCPL